MKKASKQQMPETLRERALKRYKLMWRVGTTLPRHVLDPENPDTRWHLVNREMQNLTYEDALRYAVQWTEATNKLMDVRVVEMGVAEPPDTVMDKL